jgi:hypothetical protein
MHKQLLYLRKRCPAGAAQASYAVNVIQHLQAFVEPRGSVFLNQCVLDSADGQVNDST